MIPIFPKFKKLEITDKENVESFTKQYPTNSDYNFAGLWSFDTDEAIQVSQLYGNLVLKSSDYITGEPFYSFLGNSKALETIGVLLKRSKKEGLKPELKLIPEINIARNRKKVKATFQLKEDRDNFDYILHIKQLIELKGKKYKKKRNMIQRFIKDNKGEIKTQQLNIVNKKIQKKIESLFYVWEKSRGKNHKDTKKELKAIQKLLINASYLNNVHMIGLFIKDLLLGFSVDETVHDNYAIIHFEKADATYKGIFEYLKQQSAIHLDKLGCKYINYEQDLGIEGLRKFKRSYRPVRMLKKYIIHA